MCANTMYVLQETKASSNLQRLWLVKELMHLTWYYQHYWRFLNLPSLIY